MDKNYAAFRNVLRPYLNWLEEKEGGGRIIPESKGRYQRYGLLRGTKSEASRLTRRDFVRQVQSNILWILTHYRGWLEHSPLSLLLLLDVYWLSGEGTARKVAFNVGDYPTVIITEAEVKTRLLAIVDSNPSIYSQSLKGWFNRIDEVKKLWSAINGSNIRNS